MTRPPLRDQNIIVDVSLGHKRVGIFPGLRNSG
jgi:hypothetical protein